MQATIQKPVRKKLFATKPMTYIVSDNEGHGNVVEIDIKVIGKRISFEYKSIRERR